MVTCDGLGLRPRSQGIGPINVQHALSELAGLDWATNGKRQGRRVWSKEGGFRIRLVLPAVLWTSKTACESVCHPVVAVERYSGRPNVGILEGHGHRAVPPPPSINNFGFY